jgi:hypothetical protein
MTPDEATQKVLEALRLLKEPKVEVTIKVDAPEKTKRDLAEWKTRAEMNAERAAHANGALSDIITLVTSCVAKDCSQETRTVAENVLDRILCSASMVHVKPSWYVHDWERDLYEKYLNRQTKACTSDAPSIDEASVLVEKSGNVLGEVAAERILQDEKWGETNHPPEWWLVILGEEIGETCKALLEGDLKKFRAEMVQVAATATATIECITRRKGEFVDMPILQEIARLVRRIEGRDA